MNFEQFGTKLAINILILNNNYILLLNEIAEKVGVKLDFGVEHKTLGELLSYEQPNKYIVGHTNYNKDFDTPILTAGQSFILGYTDERHGVYKADRENPVIIFDDFTTSNHWVEFNFKVKSSAMKLLKAVDRSINFRYCYHYMKIIKVDITEHKRMWISEFSKIKIPIPPLYVQNHIVDILDKFDTLTNDIMQGLPKEI